MEQKVLNSSEFVNLLEFIRGHQTPEFEFNSDVMDFVKSSGLMPRIYQKIKTLQCNQFLTQRICNDFKVAYLGNMVRNRQIFMVWQDVLNLLKEIEVEVVALKGCALAFGVYSDSAIRPMGDLDVLVEEGKAEKAREYLIKKGAIARYIPQSRVHDHVHAHVSSIVYKGVLVEIHQRLYALGDSMNPDLKKMFSSRYLRPTEDGDLILLPDAYMIYHIATHTWYGYQLEGIRLGWLLDIAELISKHSNRDELINDLFEINPTIKKQLKIVVDWSMVLAANCDDKIIPGKNFPDIKYFYQPGRIKQLHRMSTVKQIFKVPGLALKYKLLYREIIPESDYLKFRYGADGFKGVFKRWFVKNKKAIN